MQDRPSEPTDHKLRQFAGYTMKRAFLALRADVTATLAPFELRTATFSALGIIIENPDLTQSQLAQALGVERSGIVVLVDELENRDLISRNKVKGDRRSYALRVTLAGRRLWQKAEAAMQRHEDRICSGLSAAEREALNDMLRRVETAAAALGEGGGGGKANAYD
ncbi:MAG: MarR family transcriptional regulator [Rhodobacteraceae bacterium]|nr:MarR family transcriptional regulator [Paracoccaceae bacterium]